MIPWLNNGAPFPVVEQALRYPNGLLAAGGDLSVERLLDAYRHGIFPWFNADEPILWWSPDPRMVLMLDEFRISRSLAKVLRNMDYEVRFDTDFERVMRSCAAPRSYRGEHHGTWIQESMIAAYCDLHRAGYAHSVEVWVPRKSHQLQVEGETRRKRANEEENIVSVYANLAGEVKPVKGGGNYSTVGTARSERGSQHSIADELELAGGLYGVSIGRMFFGESMFSFASNTSKIALAHLVRQLERWQFRMIDCQMNTAHLASLGAREIPRAEFITRLEELVNCEPVTHWQFDRDLFPRQTS